MVSLADQPQELLQREVLVDEVLEQIGKGSSSTLPGPGGINEVYNLLLQFALTPEQWKQGTFLGVPKGPEEPQIWKSDFLMDTMLPEKVELIDI